MSTSALLLVPNTKNKTIQGVRVNFDGMPRSMLPALKNVDVKDVVKAKEIRGIKDDGSVEPYSGGKFAGVYRDKDAAVSAGGNMSYTYYYSVNKKKWTQVRSVKDIKESENKMEDLKDMLNTRAIEKVESMRDDTRPDFDELGVDVNEARIVKKFHAKGGMTKHKKASSEGQKTQLTGKSKTKRKVAGRKLKKTLRKMGAGKKARAAKKRSRAVKKRGGSFKRS